VQTQEYAGNQLLARHISEKGFDAIINEYVYIDSATLEKSLRIIPGAWKNFAGKGIDLGGGVGLISSTIAKRNEVEQIYCVELVEDVVRLCQPIVAQRVLGERMHKVISVIGDFDRINLPDNSLDFAVCWFSMHHSCDPVRTLAECRRVLKAGACLCLIERAHNNNTPETEIQRMLNIIYSKEFLIRNYRPVNQVLTRRDNGEHEYRYREWESFFTAAGFTVQSAVVIKTDSPENAAIINDHGIKELSVPYPIGCFGNRKVGYLLRNEMPNTIKK
jgi:ubiquinone/menaquinone biosynthesis C-methylase UbiE